MQYCSSRWTLIPFENLIWIIMCVDLPASHVLQERRRFSYTLRKECFRKAVFVEADHHFTKVLFTLLAPSWHSLESLQIIP